MDAKTDENAGKCPFTGGTRGHANRDWTRGRTAEFQKKSLAKIGGRREGGHPHAGHIMSPSL
jgi:hypothetical protein